MPDPTTAGPRVVIFDWDSTLVDNWPCIARALNATFEEHGLPSWSVDQARAGAKMSLRDRFPKLFGADRWEAAAAYFYQRFEEFHLDELSPLPGAEELLDELQARQIHACVVSNKTGAYLRAEATHLGWDRFFTRIIGATDAERDKPAVDPVHLALDGTECAAGGQVWFVGDAVTDLQCAHASGCVPILVETGDISQEEREAWPPRHVFEDLLGLVNFIKNG